MLLLLFLFFWSVAVPDAIVFVLLCLCFGASGKVGRDVTPSLYQWLSGGGSASALDPRGWHA